MMKHTSDHAFSQTPFEPVARHEDYTLLGRYVPEAENGHDQEYHIETHAQGAVQFWAVVYAPRSTFQNTPVGTAEERLMKAAVAYARELIESGAEPREEPYRRALQGARREERGRQKEQAGE